MRSATRLLLTVSVTTMATGLVHGAGVPVLEDWPVRAEDVVERFPELQINPGKILGNSQWAITRDRWPGLETPHVVWGKPYARGRVRVLWIANSRSADLRVAKELEARFDFDVRLCCIPWNNWMTKAAKRAAAPWGEKFMLRWLKPQYHAIVLADGDEDLTEPVRKRIVEQVERGAGLVCRYFWNKIKPNSITRLVPFEGINGYGASGAWEVKPDALIAAGIPFAAFPPTRLTRGKVLPAGKVLATMLGKPFLVAGQHGRGRTLGILDYTWGAPMMPGAKGEDHLAAPHRYWEYWFSLLGKAILWVGQREPTVQVGLPGHRKVAQFAATAVPLTLTNAGKQPAKLAIEMTVRDDRYEPVGGRRGRSATVPAGKATVVKFPLPSVMRNGFHFVDFIVRRPDKKVVTWGSTSVEIASALKPTIAAPQDVLKRTDTAKVDVQVDGALPGGRQAEMVVEVWDTYDRCLVRRRSGARANGWRDTVSMAVAHTQSTELRVVARLVTPGGPVLRCERSLYVPMRRWDDFAALMWPTSVHQFWLPHEYDVYRAVGVNAVLVGMWAHSSWAVRVAARGNMWVHGHGGGPQLRDYDPAKETKRILDKTGVTGPRIKRYGAMDISLADEPHGSKPLELTDTIRGLYRAHLQKKFGQVSRLNAEWDTSYKGWGEIEPMYVKEAADRANPAPWLEYRMFEDSLVAGYVAKINEAWRREAGRPVDISYDGTFGFTGHVIPYGRFDVAKLIRAGVSSWLPYSRGQLMSDYIQGENSQWFILRSLLDGPLATSWYGYGMPPESFENGPWSAAIYGAGGIAYFYGPGFTLTTGALHPRARLIGEATRGLRRGIGKMLMRAKLDMGEVALMFDQPSMYLHWLTGRRKDVQVQLHRFTGDARAAYEFLLMDNQVPFRWVTAEGIRTGKLDGIKLLWLPCVSRLSKPTADAIRKWVHGGGVVVADLTPGVFNENGRPMLDGPLDSLFGFKRKELKYDLVPADYTVGNYHNDGAYQLGVEWFRPEVYETGIAATDGKALGKHILRTKPPALVLKRTGKGAALYMNWIETFYQRHREHRVRRFMKHVLNLAGVTPRNTIVHRKRVMPFYRVTRLVDGPIEHVGLRRSATLGADHPDRVEVHLARPAHAYNVRDRRYLGCGNKHVVRLKPGRGTAVTCVPYEITGVEVQWPAKAVPGQVVPMTARLRTTGGTPGTHVLRVDVVGPKGRPIDALSGNMLAPSGVYKAERRLAVNDPTGTWTVRVQDPITGKTAEARLEVATGK